jgi:hypothetical protein
MLARAPMSHPMHTYLIRIHIRIRTARASLGGIGLGMAKGVEIAALDIRREKPASVGPHPEGQTVGPKLAVTLGEFRWQ